MWLSCELFGPVCSFIPLIINSYPFLSSFCVQATPLCGKQPRQIHVLLGNSCFCTDFAKIIPHWWLLGTLHDCDVICMMDLSASIQSLHSFSLHEVGLNQVENRLHVRSLPCSLIKENKDNIGLQGQCVISGLSMPLPIRLHLLNSCLFNNSHLFNIDSLKNWDVH